MVLEDVRNGLVSPKRAKEVYGVVLKERSLEVDSEKTEKLRRQKAK
jgi:hypothetical protein